MKELLITIKKYIKENLIQLSIVIGVFLISILITVLYFNIPRLTFKLDSELDAYVVDKAFGDSKSYTIPKSYKDKPVRGIGERAFSKHHSLESLEFEDIEGIEYIGKLAFTECFSFRGMDLTYVDYIGRSAFSYCYTIRDAKIGASKILGSAFYKCTALESVLLLEGCESIGSMAFAQTKISDIILPSSVEFVYENAFSFNDNLKSVTIKNASLLENSYITSLGDIVKKEI